MTFTGPQLARDFGESSRVESSEGITERTASANSPAIEGDIVKVKRIVGNRRERLRMVAAARATGFNHRVISCRAGDRAVRAQVANHRAK